MEAGPTTSPARSTFQVVSVGGYEVAGLGAVVQPVTPTGPVREVDPQSDPTLFANFGALWRGPGGFATREGRQKLLAFANEWGLLGGPNADTVQEWERQAGWMHTLFEVWQGIRLNDQQRLDEAALPNFFKADPEGAPASITKEDAAAFLAAFVTSFLSDTGSESTRLEVEGTRFQVRRGGATLLRTLWLQFAEAIEQDLDLQACLYCGRWREVVKRSLYCSNACRQKASRLRKRLALAEYEEGANMDQITKVARAPKATVARWISQHESERKSQ